MAVSTPVAQLSVEDYDFPAAVKAPGSDNSFFLGGAGVRGIEIGGRVMKITAIGVYLEEAAVPALSGKWKGRTTDELASSVEFFSDIISGPFEKFIQMTMLVPLTGREYSKKVADKCVETWKAIGIYTEEEGKAIDKFVEAFKDVDFAPGHSILYTQSPSGSLTIAFSKHESIPVAGNAVIENKILSASILESLVGKYGVAPEVKQSCAARLPQVLNN